jgi:hypothetical protein
MVAVIVDVSWQGVDQGAFVEGLLEGSCLICQGQGGKSESNVNLRSD